MKKDFWKERPTRFPGESKTSFIKRYQLWDYYKQMKKWNRF